MPKPSEKRKLTPDDVESRAKTPEGLRGLDAPVARAMGWRTKLDPMAPKGSGRIHWYRVLPRGREETRTDPPPYASCPADAPDRWRWWGEMLEAAFAAGYGLDCERALGSTRMTYYVTHDMLDCEDDESLPLALVKALAAAGLLEEESDAKAE